MCGELRCGRVLQLQKAGQGEGYCYCWGYTVRTGPGRKRSGLVWGGEKGTSERVRLEGRTSWQCSGKAAAGERVSENS